MKNALLLSLAFSAVTAGAADAFTIIRWDRLYTYEGTATSPMTTTYPETPPAGWGISIESNEGNLQVNAQASRRRSQPGVTTKDWFGKGDFLVNVQTTKSTTSKFTLTVRHTGIANANADCLFQGSMAYGRASTTYPSLKTREVKSTLYQVSDSDSKGPTSIKKGWTFNNQTWTNLGGGLSEVNLIMATGTIAGKGVAISPGNGSNNIAAVGHGNAIEKLKVLGLAMAPASGNAGFISGTRDAFVDHLEVEVRNTYNALLDTWSVGGAPVDWDLPFTDFADGTYRLIFWTAGSLRKKIEVAYVGSTGVSGVNASLLYGDIDWNNTITQAEADAIATYNGRTWLDAGWRDEIPGIGCRVMDCDLNQDNQITSADYLLAVGNVGLTGD